MRVGRAVGVLLVWQLRQQAEADEWGEVWTNERGLVFTRQNGAPRGRST